MSSPDLNEASARFHVPDDNAALLDVIVQAAKDEMHVIYNGPQLLVCSIIPVGWKKLTLLEPQKAAPRELYASRA